MKIKIITGFREDQFYTIESEEAHKAYYLFNNPNERGTFQNGVALIGSDIRGIEPDYNSIMGYNPDYKLLPEDWNIISARGIDEKVRKILTNARAISKLDNVSKEILDAPLSETIKLLPPENKQIAEGVKQLANKMSV